MFWLWQLFVQAMEKQKNTEIEVKSANVEEGNASAILTETDGKVAFDKVATVAMLMFLVIVSLLLIRVKTYLPRWRSTSSRG